MRAPPANLLVEPFFVAFDALPTNKVRAIVGAHRFDHMIGETIAAFASMNNFSLAHSVLLQIS